MERIATYEDKNHGLNLFLLFSFHISALEVGNVCSNFFLLLDSILVLQVGSMFWWCCVLRELATLQIAMPPSAP
jgi:hypothetical protein